MTCLVSNANELVVLGLQLPNGFSNWPTVCCFMLVLSFVVVVVVDCISC